jgi:hypothetical protein
VVDAYNDTGAGTHYLHKFTPNDGKFVLATNGGGLTFPDSTTQVTAGIADAPSDGSQYARKDATWEVVSGGGGVAWGAITGTLSTQTDLQGELDLKAPLNSPVFTTGIECGGVTLTGPSGNPTFTYSGLDLSPSSGGITFADATVQTTAAVAPPSADVMTANAIAANVQSMGYGASNWVGTANPAIATLVSWGTYNPTDGYIAYSSSIGNSFYLASTPTTLTNTSIQVNGSNSSFYVA